MEENGIISNSTDTSYNPWADVNLESETIIDSFSAPNVENKDYELPYSGEDAPVSEQEEEDGIQLPTSEEADVEEINVSYFLANALKEKGILPKEIDIPEDISDEDVLNIYAYINEEKIRQKVEADVAEVLQGRGITEEHLQYAMALSNGIDPNEVSEYGRFKSYAESANNYDLDSDKKINIIKTFHEQRGLAEDEIADRIEDIEYDDEKLERDWKRATDFFANKVKEFEQENARISYEREQQRYETQKRNKEILDNIYRSGIISGEKMTPRQLEEYKSGIYNRDQIVEVGGQVYTSTKFEKFLFDFQNNFETQLLAFKLMNFREVDKKIIEEQASVKAKDDIFNSLKTKIIKGGVPSKKIKSVDGREYEISKDAKVIKV
jgi:hypothetical protein